MEEGRIQTELWVQAQIRRCTVAGIPATVVRRGDRTGGMVLLKVNTLDSGCRVLTMTRDMEGRLAWLAAMKGERVAEAEADAYIARQIDRDPDLWVVEVEDRQGRTWFDGREL